MTTEHTHSWTPEQSARLATLLEQQATDPSTTLVAFWNSDAYGCPANGGAKNPSWRVRPGLVQEISGILPSRCGEGALHVTTEPHRWAGCRVWIVALLGERRHEDSKAWALRREIVGEVMPEEALSDSIGVRLGRSANLYSANLRSANLCSANLCSANLYSANLYSADLYSANLYSADLRSADLRSADLRSANLSSADLRSANLSSANLYSANLYSADLRSADLRSADLESAYVGEKPAWLPDLYEVRNGYICRKEG